MKPLVKWNPFGELSILHREIDDLFRRVFELSGEWMPGFLRERVFPALECFYKDGNLVVKAELPGIDPKDIDISITGNQLTIKGERKAEKDVREEDYMLMERSYGSFSRSITLPEGVDTTKVHATYHDGILDITMPCTSALKTQKIPIEIAPVHTEEVKKAA